MSLRERKMIIKGAIYLTVFAGMIFFLLNPSIASLRQNKQKIASKENELNGIYKKIDSLQKITKHPDEFKATSEVVNNLWPDSSNVSQFMVQTENLAKSNNLILENFSISEIKKQAAKATTDDSDGTTAKATDNKKEAAVTGSQFTFSLVAPYPSILNIIKGFETLPRFNSISSISLSGGADGNISMRLTGNIYYGK